MSELERFSTVFYGFVRFPTVSYNFLRLFLFHTGRQDIINMGINIC